MFRLIPLRSLVRTPRHRVDDFMPMDMGDLVTVQREMFAPARQRQYQDQDVLPSDSWSMLPDKSHTVLLTAGTLHLTLYSLQRREQKSLVLTPEHVSLDGRMHYGSPAMVEWSAGVFYRMRAGDDDGCSLLTFLKRAEGVSTEAVEPLLWNFKHCVSSHHAYE